MVKAILFDFYGVLYQQRRLGFRRKYVRNEALLQFSQTLRPTYKIGLFTNMGTGVVDKYFTQQELDDYFDELVIAGDVKMVKPDPDVYELAAKIMRLEPQECVLVDDTPANCKGAELAGMRAVLYRSTDQAQQDLSELLRIQ
jgi:HAD superfamily hydrolase (TIGR01493 family)